MAFNPVPPRASGPIPNQMSVRARARDVRKIPPHIWEGFKEVIYSKYIDEQLELLEVKNFLEKRHRFSATVGQYKAQLAKWDMKRNLNPTDAAHILRLLVEAERDGIRRVVKCRNQIKNRYQIKAYIERSDQFDSEEELLRHIDPSENKPEYISYTDTDLNLKTPLQEPELAETSHMSPASTLSTGHTAQSGIPTPEPRNLYSSGPRMSHSSSLSSINSAELNIHSTAASKNISWEQFFVDDNLDYERLEMNVDPEANKQLFDQVMEDVSETSPIILRQITGKLPANKAASTGVMLHSLLSATPVALIDSDEEMTAEGGGEDVSSPIQEIHPHIIEPQGLGTHAGSSNASASFLSHCFRACIRQGQGLIQKSNESLRVAMEKFEDLVKANDDDTLSRLNGLVWILEAHGQRQMATSILDRASQITTKHQCEELTTTINVLSAVIRRLDVEKVTAQWNSERMRGVHQAFVTKFGPRSKSALSASYNVAWILMLEAQNDAKKLDDALDILDSIRGPCERIFGVSNCQTISCSATYARNCFKQGNAELAEAIISDVITRLSSIYRPFHPCVLEARGRQAVFLEQMGKFDEAEKILMDVVGLKFAVLGPQNLRCQETLKDLDRILRKQGRSSEIPELFQKFLYSVNQEFEDARWKAY